MELMDTSDTTPKFNFFTPTKTTPPKFTFGQNQNQASSQPFQFKNPNFTQPQQNLFTQNQQNLNNNHNQPTLFFNIPQNQPNNLIPTPNFFGNPMNQTQNFFTPPLNQAQNFWIIPNNPMNQAPNFWINPNNPMNQAPNFFNNPNQNQPFTNPYQIPGFSCTQPPASPLYCFNPNQTPNFFAFQNPSLLNQNQNQFVPNFGFNSNQPQNFSLQNQNLPNYNNPNPFLNFVPTKPPSHDSPAFDFFRKIGLDYQPIVGSLRDYEKFYDPKLVKEKLWRKERAKYYPNDSLTNISKSGTNLSRELLRIRRLNAMRLDDFNYSENQKNFERGRSRSHTNLVCHPRKYYYVDFIEPDSRFKSCASSDYHVKYLKKNRVNFYEVGANRRSIFDEKPKYDSPLSPIKPIKKGPPISMHSDKNRGKLNNYSDTYLPMRSRNHFENPNYFPIRAPEGNLPFKLSEESFSTQVPKRVEVQFPVLYSNREKTYKKGKKVAKELSLFEKFKRGLFGASEKEEEKEDFYKLEEKDSLYDLRSKSEQKILNKRESEEKIPEESVDVEVVDYSKLEREQNFVILTKEDYYTIPSISRINEKIKEHGRCNVTNFEVGHKLWGKIFFEGRVNVTGLNLDKIVTIKHGLVELYPLGGLPPVGFGLNRAAVITLEKIFPSNTVTGKTVVEAGKIGVMGFKKYLEAKTKSYGGEFRKYDIITGTWIFGLPKFSREVADSVHFPRNSTV